MMQQKQSALEAVKAIAVPGTPFLNKMSSGDIFKSSLFFLILLGTIFIVFLLSSLLFKSRWKRAVYLLAGLVSLSILMLTDRLIFSFLFVSTLSFASFYLLTLPNEITLPLQESLVLLLSILLLSGTLFYGSRHDFFLKARDKFLFDSAIGHKIITFYYVNSPLATSLVSKERGIYQGLIYYGGVKGDKSVYFGKGLFINSQEKIKAAADFVISEHGGQLFMTNRYGRQTQLNSITLVEVEKAVDSLFSMKGFLILIRDGLYFLPAGLLILLLMGVRWVTKRKNIFFIANIGTALFIVFFITGTTFVGNRAPEAESLESVSLTEDGLSIAHFLSEKKKISAPYIPIIKKMAGSEKPLFRYWGAYLLGLLGDKKEAQTLLTLMEDPYLNVRYVAAHSLYRLQKDRSYSPLLKHLVSDPSWYVRCKIFSIFLNAGIIPSPA
ncbi:HEAT repeat domain-containing protein [Thermodesulfobacteriota bacterium]